MLTGFRAVADNALMKVDNATYSSAPQPHAWRSRTATKGDFQL